MSLWLLKKPVHGNSPSPAIDGITVALVEAATIGAARTAAVALDSRFDAAYWADATSTEIDSDTVTTSYQGGLFGNLQADGGVA